MRLLGFLDTALLFDCKWAASHSMTPEAIYNGNIGWDPPCKHCTLCTHKQRMQHWLRQWNKNKCKVINPPYCSSTNNEFWGENPFKTKGTIPSWLKAEKNKQKKTCDLLVWIFLSQVSALHVDILYWTCRWHQKSQYLQLLADHRHKPDNN